MLQRATFGLVVAGRIGRPIKSRPKIALQHGTLEWTSDQAFLILLDERIQKRERFAMFWSAQQLFRVGAEREIELLGPKTMPGRFRHRIKDVPQPIPRMRRVRIEDRAFCRTGARDHAHAQGHDSWSSFHLVTSGLFASQEKFWRNSAIKHKLRRVEQGPEDVLGCGLARRVGRVEGGSRDLQFVFGRWAAQRGQVEFGHDFGR